MYYFIQSKAEDYLISHIRPKVPSYVRYYIKDVLFYSIKGPREHSYLLHKDQYVLIFPGYSENRKLLNLNKYYISAV